MSRINYFSKIRIILSVLFLFLILFLGSSVSINASTITYSDNQLAGYYVTETTAKRLGNVATHYLDQGKTMKNDIHYQQQVNVLIQPCNNNSKLVTWAVKNSDGSGFVRKTVAQIATDYELNHPGWKVLGATNADQYYFAIGEKGHENGSDYFIPQPYGPLIADGEKWFSISAKPYGGNGTYIAGFLNNGTQDQILEGYTNWDNQSSLRVRLSSLYLSIIDENNQVIAKHLINKVNETPNEGESSLFTPYYTGTLTMPPLSVTGDHLFVVSNAEQAYMSNSVTYTYKSIYDQKLLANAQNAFFGKGTIDQINQSTSLTKGQFAISVNNASLLADLAIGKNILVQYEYEGPMNEVESATAYHTRMRSNNQDLSSSSSYNAVAYPRSVFGRTSSGAMALVTVDGKQASTGKTGTNQDETNAILKHYGIVEAYQVDGGGSVTMVVRDNGTFKVVNSPADGSARSVLSAMLLITRDVQLTTKQTASTETSVTINVKIANTFERNITNMIVKMNNESYPVVDGYVTVDNLEKGNTYSYDVYVQDEKGVSKTDFGGSVITQKGEPQFYFCELKESEQGVTFVPHFDNASAILSLTLIYEGNEYDLLDPNLIINDFDESKVASIEYSVALSEFLTITKEVQFPYYRSTVIFDSSNKLSLDFIVNLYQ
ncbi:MAG: phosphodiester glycosidase family protein [Bacilli bacterium]